MNLKIVKATKTSNTSTQFLTGHQNTVKTENHAKTKTYSHKPMKRTTERETQPKTARRGQQYRKKEEEQGVIMKEEEENKDKVKRETETSERQTETKSARNKKRER